MKQPSQPDLALRAAADALRSSGALLVAAGAGMGVDSGLPDFRGPGGFWGAFPPAARLGLRFEELASPRWFRDDPVLAWSFYGWRLNAYRGTAPHRGYEILRRIGETLPGGTFVVTSNVDGHFQKAGFPRVFEEHGSLLHLQCTARCGAGLFDAPAEVPFDAEAFRALPPLPACSCGALARPNVLMFSDWGWDGRRSDQQEAEFMDWLEGVRDLVVVECGAGTTLPAVRIVSEHAQARGATLIRVDPREPEGPPGTISIQSGALAALEAIERLL